MFNDKTRLLLLITVFALAVLPFQNCGQGKLKVSEEMSSLSSVQDIVQSVDEHDTGDADVAKVQTTYEPILVDRVYLKALLTDIFGPSTSSVDSNKSFSNGTEYGSPCSVYEDYTALRTSDGARVSVDSTAICSDTAANYLVAPVNPKGTVTRAALMARTCSDLTTNNTTFTYALRKISSKNIPEANEENIKTLFNLFYRDKGDPSQGVIDSLLLMFPQSNVTTEHWRVVIYTVCISNYWQVL